MAVLPTVVAEIEFDAGTWTDVSADLVGFGTRRGRNRESGAFQAGTATITLRNDTRQYDPDNSAGAHYGKLRPNRRVRIRATWSATTYPIFQGYIDSIEQRPGGPRANVAVIVATDLFKILNRTELPASAYAAEVAADAPKLWWRLDEPSGSTATFDASGNGHSGTVAGSVTFGAAGLIVRDPGSAAQFAEAANSYVTAKMTLDQATPFALEFWIALSANPTFIQLVSTGAQGFAFSSAPVNAYTLQINNVTRLMAFDLYNGAGTDYQLNFPTALNAGQKYHVVVTHDSDRVLRGYVDGALAVTGATTSGNFSITDVFLGSPNNQAAPNAALGEFAVYTAASTALSTTRIAAHNTAARTPWNGDLPGPRMTRILDLAAVPAGDRTIDTGSTTLQSSSLGGNALDYAQKIEETTDGALFIARDGKVTFVARNSLVTGAYLTSAATLVDAHSGTGIGYRAAGGEVTEAVIVTRATVSRDGSVAITWKDATAAAEFQLIDETHDGLLHNSDAYSLAYAQWIVNSKKNPATRVGAVDVELFEDPAALLALELAQRVTWKRKPQNTGATTAIDMRVDGIAHQAVGKEWHTTLQLAPFDPAGYPVFVWDTTKWDQQVWGF